MRGGGAVLVAIVCAIAGAGYLIEQPLILVAFGFACLPLMLLWLAVPKQKKRGGK